VSRTPTTTHSKKVARARRLIGTGFYDDPEIVSDVVDLVVADARPRSLLRELDTCEVGDGNAYRDLVTRVFIRAFGGAVDVPLVRREFPLAGGRGDIELPFHIDALRSSPKFADWRDQFRVSSVLIEVKNERSRGPVDHVRQITEDVRCSPLGRVGFLVCRNGLTTDAKQRLREVNRNKELLILPFDHEELRRLCHLPSEQMSRYLHRKELAELRCTC
jgi:hypothetical protein